MAERGATPQVPALQRRAFNAVRSLFTPLLPDDYLELMLEQRTEALVRETEQVPQVRFRSRKWLRCPCQVG